MGVCLDVFSKVVLVFKYNCLRLFHSSRRGRMCLITIIYKPFNVSLSLTGEHILNLPI